MVNLYIGYWYTIPIPKEEAWDKMYEWFQSQKKAKFKKSDTERPTHIHVTQGNAMAGLKKPNTKKEMLINLFDDSENLKRWNCDENVKSVLKLQAAKPGSGRMTKKMHMSARKKWLDGYFKELFDLLGGKPMQVQISKKEVSVTADGSFPEDYSFE